MPKDATRRDWAERLARVVDHIADHLEEPLDLDGLARVACFSPCHFHRLWRGMTGETVADCLVRLRLHRASVDLVRTDMPIGKIAGRAGYGSVPAFSRAFARAYGRPPVAYRRTGRLAPPLPVNIKQPGDASMPDMRIQTIDPVRLAALSHRGPYTEIGQAFDRLWVWAAARGLIEQPFRMFAIYHDDHARREPRRCGPRPG